MPAILNSTACLGCLLLHKFGHTSKTDRQKHRQADGQKSYNTARERKREREEREKRREEKRREEKRREEKRREEKRREEKRREEKRREERWIGIGTERESQRGRELER